jgi:RNA polymerase sigma-70 factor (ECF subfamily)
MKAGELSDNEIIKEILSGDKDKYALLMQKYNQRLYRICKGYLKDEFEIEDVMQDTYIKGYENLQLFEGRSQFGSWLIRILINEALQRLRKLNKRSPLFEPGQNTKSMNHSDYSTPETKSLNKELRSLIEDKLDTLPETYKVVFMMREVEKMNVIETAESLMISPANVKVRLNRAKEMLKKTLLESYPLEELFEFNLVRCSRVAENVLKRVKPKNNLFKNQI